MTTRTIAITAAAVGLVVGLAIGLNFGRVRSAGGFQNVGTLSSTSVPIIQDGAGRLWSLRMGSSGRVEMLQVSPAFDPVALGDELISER